MNNEAPKYNPPALLGRRDLANSYDVAFAPAGLRDEEELSLDFAALMEVWLRRWRPALVVGLIAAVVVAVVGLRQKPVYTATALVVIEPHAQQIVPLGPNQAQQQQPDQDTSSVDTEVLMASSQALAERLVQRDNLAKDPEFAGAPSAKHGPPTLAEIADGVRSHLQVRRVGLTATIQFQFKSHSPEKAARLANDAADEFINWGLDSRTQQNQHSADFINAHLNSLQAEAQAAETAVEQYKIAHGLMSAAGQTIAEQQVGTLGEQIAQAEADVAEKRARLNAANEQESRGGSGQDIGAALNSTTVGSLRTQQAEASRRLAELKSHYGPLYPDVQKAESQLADINSKIQDEANRIHSSLRAELNAAEQRLSSLRSSQYSAQGSLAANGRAEVGLIELERKAEASRQLYDAFLNQSKVTSVQGAEQPDARLYDRATAPELPTSPNPKILFLLATLAGLVAAAGTIATLELFDTSLRTSDDVQKRFGLPVVGVIPTPLSTDLKNRSLARLPPFEYLVKRPFSVFAESFRNLRAGLLVPTASGRRCRVVAVASSLPSEGKSTIAFCLMRTIALSGVPTVLVDCDVRQRGASNYGAARGGAGLVEVLEGSSRLADALVYDAESGGYLLPVISRPKDQVDLFSSEAMDRLMEELQERFQVVIIDTPAALAVADARIVAARADAVLFVAQWAKTPAKAVELGLELFSSVGANIAGVILSRVDLKRQARQSYGGASYYGHYAKYYES